jgi:hypothetical protein
MGLWVGIAGGELLLLYLFGSRLLSFRSNAMRRTSRFDGKIRITMRTPTEQGRPLLDEIEGFRLFLNEVDRSSMDRHEPPHVQPGSYEKYLPYAVALEVEQGWCDRFLALASTLHRAESVPGSESLYLGMWDGKPVEIVYAPQSARGH